MLCECYWIATEVLRVRYRSVAGVLKTCYGSKACRYEWVQRDCYGHASAVLRGCYVNVTGLLRGRYRNATGVTRGLWTGEHI